MFQSPKAEICISKDGMPTAVNKNDYGGQNNNDSNKENIYEFGFYTALSLLCCFAYVVFYDMCS